MRSIARSRKEKEAAQVWHSEIWRAFHLILPIRVGVAVTSLLSGVLVLREARGIEGGPSKPYGAPMSVVFLVAWLIVGIGAIWVVWRSRVPSDPNY